MEEAIASHKKSGDYRGVGSDEYLSGFLKKDRLMPVVTLVVCFDAKKWDGPTSLHEMFDCREDTILALVPDYKINLLAPAAIAEEDFDKFHTSLREVLAFIKYSGDAGKMTELLDSEPAYRHLGRKEVDVLNSCAQANLVMEEDKEALDVCEAFQVLTQRAAKEAAIKTFIETCREFGASLADTTGKFAKKFSVPEQDAAAIVKKYW